MPSPWSHVVLPSPIHAIAARGVWAVAALADGRLAGSSDAGARWTVGTERVAGAPSPALLPLAGSVLLGTEAGVVRAAARERWAPSAPVPADVAVTALAGRRAATIAGTRRRGVFRSVDGGLSWEASGRGLPLGGSRLRVFAASAGRGGLVVAHALGLSRSRDGGRSWATADRGLPLRIPDATLAADGRALYAGIGGRLYRAVASEGFSWSEVYDGLAAGPPLRLLGAARGLLFGATGAPPLLLASVDGGTSWAPVGAPLPASLAGVAVAGGWLLAVTADGSLWRRPIPDLVTPSTLTDPPPLSVEASSAEADLVASFSLEAPAPVRLVVQDALEHEVACLAEGAFSLGPHTARLPGGTIPPGIYRLRLLAGAQSRAVPFALLG